MRECSDGVRNPQAILSQSKVLLARQMSNYLGRKNKLLEMESRAKTPRDRVKARAERVGLQQLEMQIDETRRVVRKLCKRFDV